MVGGRDQTELWDATGPRTVVSLNPAIRRSQSDPKTWVVFIIFTSSIYGISLSLNTFWKSVLIVKKSKYYWYSYCSDDDAMMNCRQTSRWIFLCLWIWVVFVVCLMQEENKESTFVNIIYSPVAPWSCDCVKIKGQRSLFLHTSQTSTHPEPHMLSLGAAAAMLAPQGG